VKLPSPSRLMTGACVLALAALALIVWSLFDPRPVPVIAAMSVGQVLGTLSFGAFVLVVLGDVRLALQAGGTDHDRRHLGDASRLD
jgi:hypothetical protein